MQEQLNDIQRTLGRIEERLEMLQDIEPRVRKLEAYKATMLGWLLAVGSSSAAGAGFVMNLIGKH